MSWNASPRRKLPRSDISEALAEAAASGSDGSRVSRQVGSSPTICADADETLMASTMQDRKATTGWRPLTGIELLQAAGGSSTSAARGQGEDRAAANARV